MPTGKQRGDYGEAVAEGYLKAQGYEIMERRYRCPRGEIDLIVRKGDVVAFVEVKKRKPYDADPGEAVTYAKRKAIIRTAVYYIHEHNEIAENVLRFDVAEVTGEGQLIVQYIEGAFDAKGKVI